MYRIEAKHIDVWGKYSIASINGNQYYILFVDDSEKFSTTEFLKTQDKRPKAIRVDRGKEFVNDDLRKTG